jgi:c-di-GMP-binding flagellar brake protein YcgR
MLKFHGDSPNQNVAVVIMRMHRGRACLQNTCTISATDRWAKSSPAFITTTPAEMENVQERRKFQPSWQQRPPTASWAREGLRARNLAYRS